jgi:alpha-1,2-mannosyltransferase
MLERVRSRRPWHTNSVVIASSSVLSYAKLGFVYPFLCITSLLMSDCTSRYYNLIMYYYSLSLRRASFLMVNSSWTKNHIDAILQHTNPFLDAVHLPMSFFINSGNQLSKPAQIVYPPCNTREVVKFPLEGRKRVILSIAQFR